jgi:ABC-type Mn2+/Zn2+ transport system permease subunit
MRNLFEKNPLLSSFATVAGSSLVGVNLATASDNTIFALAAPFVGAGAAFIAAAATKSNKGKAATGIVLGAALSLAMLTMTRIDPQTDNVMHPFGIELNRN